MEPQKKTLILNLLAETVGDTLFYTPLFKMIKRDDPQAHLAITVPKIYRPLLDHHPRLDELIEVPGLELIGKESAGRITKLFGYLRIMLWLSRRIKKEHFDRCFVMVPNFAPMQIIPFLGGVKERIGYTYPGALFSWLLTKKTPFISCQQDPERHYLESYIDLLRLAGMEIAAEDKVVEKFLLPSEEREAMSILKKEGIKDVEKTIIFQAGAKWPSKRWDASKYAEIGRRLARRGYQVVLAGSLREKELNEQIRMTIGEKAVNLCGKTGFGQLAAVLKRCRMVMGNDSGLIHLASAVGTTTLVIYGSTTPKHSRPLGPGKFIPIHHPTEKVDISDSAQGQKAMARIKTEEVWKALVAELRLEQ